MPTGRRRPARCCGSWRIRRRGPQSALFCAFSRKRGICLTKSLGASLSFGRLTRARRRASPPCADCSMSSLMGLATDQQLGSTKCAAVIGVVQSLIPVPVFARPAGRSAASDVLGPAKSDRIRGLVQPPRIQHRRREERDRRQGLTLSLPSTRQVESIARMEARPNALRIASRGRDLCASDRLPRRLQLAARWGQSQRRVIRQRDPTARGWMRFQVRQVNRRSPIRWHQWSTRGHRLMSLINCVADSVDGAAASCSPTRRNSRHACSAVGRSLASAASARRENRYCAN
jgi:hypothetical protein